MKGRTRRGERATPVPLDLLAPLPEERGPSCFAAFLAGQRAGWPRHLRREATRLQADDAAGREPADDGEEPVAG